MKLFPIFSRNPSLLTSETRKNLHSVIEKMNAKTTTTISRNGNSFSTQYVTGGILKENNNALFSSLSEQYSFIDFNNKRYVVNNATGEIKAENKSISDIIIGISPKTIQGISETIKQIKENFENPKVVKQHRWGVDGLTKNGAERLRETQERIFYKQKTERMIQSKW